MNQGGGIMALDVGLGKTFAGVALATMLKKTGKAKKPMIVTPKSLLPNMRENFLIGQPDARLLVIGQHQDKKR